jgi:hypothetical protein
MKKRKISRPSMVANVNGGCNKSKSTSEDTKLDVLTYSMTDEVDTTLYDDYVAGISFVYKNVNKEIFGSSYLCGLNLVKSVHKNFQMLSPNEQQSISKRSLLEIKEALSKPSVVDIHLLNNKVLTFLAAWNQMSTLDSVNNDIGVVIMASEEVGSEVEFRAMSIEDFLIQTKFGSDEDYISSDN